MKENLEPVRIRTKLKLFKGLPDLSPFLCIFFLILIFFMIGTNFVQVSGIKVELPQTAGGSSFGAQKFVITLDRNGKIYFNDLLFSGENAMLNLRNRLAEIRNSVPSSRMTVLVRADSSVTFRDLASVLALAEKLDINVFLLTGTPVQALQKPQELE